MTKKKKSFQKYLETLHDNDHIDTIVNASINTVSEITKLPVGVSKLSLAAGVFGTLISSVALGKSVYSAYKDWKESKEYSVSITHPNPAYDAAQDWISELANPEDIHSLSGIANPYVPRDRRDSAHRFVRFDFGQEIEVKTVLNGHHISLSTYLEEPSDRDQRGDASKPSKAISLRSKTIVISAKTVEGFTALGEELERRVQDMQDSVYNKPKVFISDKWGDFVPKNEFSRPASSIILSEGVMDSILDHVQTFLDSEDKYHELSLPYHTGILFYGPPGTGKTSIAKSLSTEFNMNMYTLDLKSMEDDSDMVNQISMIPARSIILLEDIDVATPSVSDRSSVRSENHSENSPGITLGGLLNVLDGAHSPIGSVIVMTTNDLESMDPAVVRSGRVDLKMIIDYLDNDQLKNICNYYLKKVPENLPEITKDMKITSAEIVGVVKNHIQNIDDSVDDLLELVSDKVSAYTLITGVANA